MQNPRVMDHHSPKNQWEKENGFYLNASKIKNNYSPADSDGKLCMENVM